MLISIPDSTLYILTLVSSLCDYSSQHSPHSLAISFHVVFISAYPAVQVKLAYVNMPGRNDLITIINLLFAKGKQSLQARNYAKGRNQRKNNSNDSFGKGFSELYDHVLNRLMTGRCPSKSLQLRPKFHSLFLQNSFDFQKSATFKGLKSSPRMYTDVSFNPEIGAFSRMEK